MKKKKQIPVIDIFAGPGGLSEGFSSFKAEDHSNPFQIELSIECDKFAHETLVLRKFFKKLIKKEDTSNYYRFLKEEISRDKLFKLHKDEHEASEDEAWLATLGKTPEKEIDDKIEKALGEEKNWVLIGGPPCQAYSIVGRSRRGGINSSDPNARLYVEYLKILQKFSPSVFIMENVKGLLSSRIESESVFEEIISHLQSPATMLGKRSNGKGEGKFYQYKIFSLVQKRLKEDLFNELGYKASDFIIKCEKYGIPQSRHRLILVGIREDIEGEPHMLEQAEEITVVRALEDLPRLRSGLSKGGDDRELWKAVLQQGRKMAWYRELREKDPDVFKELENTLETLNLPRNGRGGEFIRIRKNKNPGPHRFFKWVMDSKISGVCNHSTRGHIADDLYRYLFASCYAEVHEKSPKLRDFPESLLPRHRNVSKALDNGLFSDRFRVQLKKKPGTTVTSHISKDGHYFIHYDPLQCRSLTVREAARLQTFPDNYFFCGPRTSQYTQVGNAVPPLLANQIAEIVFELLNRQT